MKLPTAKTLKIEVGVVYATQLALIIGLVEIDRLFGLSGYLHTLVAVIFIILPVIALDRSDKPYERYGIAWSSPLVDVLYALILMVLTFPLIAIFVTFVPSVWGIQGTNWNFEWPDGYPGLAFSHLIVVAIPEEIFFRGYLMGRLDDILKKRRRLFGAEIGWSLPIQALLFALGHFLVDFHIARLLVFFPALVFGWLKAKRGTIGSSVVFHASSNIFMEITRAGYGL